MRKSKFSESQIVGILKDAESGVPVADLLRKYARDRTHLTGLPEVQTLANSLPQGASVLDVGCGNGIPLTQFLVEAGFDVVGVDSSAKMLEKFRINLPNTPVICEKIESCDLQGKVFDAAISWGVIFHLTPAEQRQAFRKLADVVKPGGLFLFTAADLIADDLPIQSGNDPY